MSKKPLVSVIIPIYNVAPYLRECLDSVLNQTYENLQIILINDGSTDESGSIAREYLNDVRVELFFVKNGGLSRARNLGMSEARGTYIYFIDSDDYIECNYIEEMVRVAQECEVDFVCNEQVIHFGSYLKGLKAKEDPKILIPDSKNIAIGGSVWRCLFSRELIERVGVRFLEGKIHEDEGFLYMLLPFCERFAMYCGSAYFYRQREGSIMAGHKKFRSYDLLDVFESIYLFYQQKGLLHLFEPPYFFLGECAIGYVNEEEYIQRAQVLIERLGIKQGSVSLTKRVLNQFKFLLKPLLIRTLWRA
ncbi:glycosyltransferase family 2 protein [Helicobacter brantae]|uniref:Glycosyltransferase 2-like domain-containing protein n=1 Tax=Helicobacter brantae TaxID=375927 RepID=A0A3D8J5Q2_9HELI|nr:glycosyltransferase family A protein [Helicobacter brantae]RDU72121.1 hypothetical protein CQA58_00515 [Helicobacter brantae]